MGKAKPRKPRFNMPGGKNSRRYKRKLSPKPLYRAFPKSTSSLRVIYRKCVYSKQYKHRVVEGCKNFFTKFQTPEGKLDGYRAISVDLLQTHFTTLANHTITCQAVQTKVISGEITTPLKLVSDVHRHGLASVLLVQCQGCYEKFLLHTSPKIDSSAAHKRFDINVRSVWGTMASGVGVAQLNETVATMAMPGMSQATFSSIEGEIGVWWKEVLERDMLAAGAEERRLAIARGDYCDGVPAITVVCDGGWSKRSHKHSYNAMGGVAITIGAETGRILHIGIRNKHCYICTLAETNKQKPKEHICFKNWTKSSQAMEADAIVEGFLEAEKKHGVRFMRLVGDGDSSVFARVQEQVPVWGSRVEKLECSNHACKCLRTNLEKLVTDKPQYKGHGKLTQAMRVRLTSGVRCAIRMRSAEAKDDHPGAIRRLQHDISNAVHHVFGNHQNCSDFCKARECEKSEEAPKAPDPENVASVSDPASGVEMTSVDKTVSKVIDEQVAYWTQGTSPEEMEESRHCNKTQPADIDKDILRDVTCLLNRLADKAGRLIGNYTTNLAECWMSVKCKFDGGKMYNRCNRGSWHARCYGGALRQNFGPEWSPSVWQSVTGTDPGQAFRSTYRARAKKLLSSKKSKAKQDVRSRAKRRKSKTTTQATKQKAAMEYGPESVDVVPDITSDDLAKACDEFYKSQVEVSPERIQVIEEQTQLQSGGSSTVWKDERRKRVTASVFGEVVSRKPSLRVCPFVQRLLYSSFRGNMFTVRGLQQEDMTIKEYVMYQADRGVNVEVEKSGLVIHPSHPFVAASPDGRVLESGRSCGLLEVKNVLQTKNWTFKEAAQNQGNFCLKLESGQLTLKTTHKFYYQCQGQLNVADMPWMDFVVRPTEPHELFVQRLRRDPVLWESVMLPKLTAFYHKCVLPELAVPRFGKSPGIREPGVWVGLKKLQSTDMYNNHI